MAYTLGITTANMLAKPSQEIAVCFLMLDI